MKYLLIKLSEILSRVILFQQHSSMDMVPVKEPIVLIGGWVSYLLLDFQKTPENTFRHVDSIDIYSIVDSDIVVHNEYRTIVELIGETSWDQVTGKQVQ